MYESMSVFLVVWADDAGDNDAGGGYRSAQERLSQRYVRMAGLSAMQSDPSSKRGTRPVRPADFWRKLSWRLPILLVAPGMVSLTSKDVCFCSSVQATARNGGDKGTP